MALSKLGIKKKINYLYIYAVVIADRFYLTDNLYTFISI